MLQFVAVEGHNILEVTEKLFTVEPWSKTTITCIQQIYLPVVSQSDVSITADLDDKIFVSQLPQVNLPVMIKSIVYLNHHDTRH